MKQNTDVVVALIASIREQVNAFILSFLSEQGITDILPAHGAVFHALFENGPMQMSDLAQVIDKKKNTVTGLINTLEDRGYCRREQDPQDARVQRIVLTKKGEAIKTKQENISEVLLHQIWDGVAVEDQQICMQALQRMLRNLRRNVTV